MNLYDSLEAFKNPSTPLVLTIGNFDGVHRGHLAVLQRTQTLMKEHAQTVVITFSNHPSEILRPAHPTLLLCTLPHKIRLLEACQVDHLVILPFTRYLAEHSAASFIERVRQFIPFSHLVLGHDATLGRDRQGDRATLMDLGEQWGFDMHYLEAYRYEGLPVSSSLIRQCIQQGELDKAEHLLGRPYSIYASVLPGLGKGKQMGFPTANIDVKGLCLPPFGVYAVHIKKNGEALPGIANLGTAPTIRPDSSPLLEVHLFSSHEDFYQQPIEVVFQQYVRPEKKFDSVEELREQIKHDITQAKKSL